MAREGKSKMASHWQGANREQGSGELCLLLFKLVNSQCLYFANHGYNFKINLPVEDSYLISLNAGSL